MNRFKEFLSSKKVKYGSFASAMTILLIVVVIAVNVLCNTLADKYVWKLDLTQSKIYSLTNTTKDILKSLDRDIQVIMVVPEGQEDPTSNEILSRYAKESDHIKVSSADPEKTPGLATEYKTDGQDLSYGAIIFGCDGKSKIVSQEDLYGSSSTDSQQVDSIKAEQAFSSAILYVTSDYNVAADFTIGHDEEGTGQNLQSIESFYKNLNASVSEINLLTQDIPDDVKLLNIVSPDRDFTADEIVKLDQFLSKGGSVQYFPKYINDSTPRLAAFLKEWGILVNNDVVLDQGPNNNYNNIVYLLPNIDQHEITQTFTSKNARILFPNSRSIKVTDVLQNVKTYPILESSDQSFSRTDFNSNSSDMIDSDVKGPLTVMLAAEKTYDNGNVGKMVIYGSQYVADSSLLSDKGYGVVDLLNGSYKYLAGQQDAIVDIASKSLTYDVLTMSENQVLSVFIILVILPIMVLILGIVIWARRRHL